MKANRFLTALTLLVLAACTQAPKPAPVIAPVPAAPASMPVVETPAVPAIDPAAFAQAQANLRALGYNPGKAGDPADPLFQRALVSFQKDQGLDQDGILGPQVMEKLRLMRAALRTVPSAAPGVFIYGGRASDHQALTLATPPEGNDTDETAKIQMPQRDGSK